METIEVGARPFSQTVLTVLLILGISATVAAADRVSTWNGTAVTAFTMAGENGHADRSIRTRGKQ